MRQIILDTETTGLEPKRGHRIIEIGCVEMINRRLTGNTFHVYINPERDVPEEAVQVHGLTQTFLADKPLFHSIAREFIDFIQGAELIIHNAPFDVGFIDHEFALLNECEVANVTDICSVVDSLSLARELHPGQKNSLDALCKRYGIDNSQRTLHSALLDSEILADVYLSMTGGQTDLNLSGKQRANSAENQTVRRLISDRKPLKVLMATADELAEHEQCLNKIASKAEQVLWRTLKEHDA
jgi:DNA polymerase-3 subunit epsilon